MIDPLGVGVTESTESELEVFELFEVPLERFYDERGLGTLGRARQSLEALSDFIRNSNSLTDHMHLCK